VTAIVHRMFADPRGVLGTVGGLLMARGNAQTERRAVELGEVSASDHVLVVGCGPGMAVRQAAQLGAQVVGIDPSPLMLRTARRRCRSVADRVQLLAGTAEHTGCATGTFDVVISVNNLHLWTTPHAGLCELRRVVGDRGRLVISAHLHGLPGSADELVTAATGSGFSVTQAMTWEPSSRLAGTAWQLVGTAND